MKKIGIAVILLLATLLVLSGCGSSTGEAKGGAETAQCNDHVDNDGDGYCDFAWKRAYCTDGSTVGDPACAAKDDNSEAGNAFCGDGQCNAAETCSTCQSDCGSCPPVCGDGQCNGAETCSTCATDCGACPPVCGNSQCETGETCTSCQSDCGTCPIPDSCSDTDGGFVPQTKGTVSGYLNSTAYSNTDSCSGTALIEWYCSSNRAVSTSYNCAGNFTTTCLDGACA